MSAGRYDWRSVLARLLFSMLLVFSLYNPSGYSFWHWIFAPVGNFWVKSLVGLLLLLPNLLIWKTVFSVLRPLGVASVALIGLLGYITLSHFELIDGGDGTTISVGVMLTLALILTAGLTQSSIMHRLTGIQHIEEVPH